jgi:hypothetical protein
LTQKTAEVQAIPGVGGAAPLHPKLFAELFASLASLLRSYTAAHGLHQQREASVDLSDEEITVRHREKWLRLIRSDAILTWTRENGIMGTMELTEAGTLRNADHEEAMDLVAEQWAREIMR